MSGRMIFLLISGSLCVAWWWWKMRSTAWIYTIYVSSVIFAYWFFVERFC